MKIHWLQLKLIRFYNNSMHEHDEIDQIKATNRPTLINAKWNKIARMGMLETLRTVSLRPPLNWIGRTGAGEANKREREREKK